MYLKTPETRLTTEITTVETGPGADLIEKRLSGTFGIHVLAMADDIILIEDALPVDAAENQITQSLQSFLGGYLRRVRAQEADAQGLLVESGRVQRLVIETATLVNRSVVADAEVVADVRPSEHGRVQHLEVTHLGGARIKISAVLTRRVMHYNPWRGCVGQW